MERQRPDMTLNVERRAGEPPPGPAELREPFHRNRGVMTPAAEKSADHGLTRRERKVKALLLRELKKSSDTKMLSYVEIKNLEKTLNVAFIEEQLAGMRKQLKGLPLGTRLAGVGYTIVAGLNLWSGISSGDVGDIALGALWAVAALALTILGPAFTRRSVRRRIFIYEALRELSGADEAGVQLSDAVNQADALITRIVDQELAAEAAKPAKSIGRVHFRDRN